MSGPGYKAIALDREGQVVRLRKEGFTFDQIAVMCDPPYSDGQGAWAAYQRAVAKNVTQPAAEARELDLLRIDALLTEWFPRAMGSVDETTGKRTPGELHAVREVNRLLIRRARILGYDAPTNHRLVVTDQVTAEIERLAAELGIAPETGAPVLAGSDETEPE